ncbi:MAG: carboxypeptidase-like regulatory domain-containing protein [Edaphobacter sp.]|uniref:carboxypeptidase-like regulatory domain-containing protein n=1 Tax=Edaphobacter sp. TaxID=1934404 RepID=UPI0023A45058|nr:carboxypeptidase-like regulatory domain-containing protein [Edaphobacter sp.]MDE1177191.1 carboxypeptidase-like regulatory domain-containing protein [Edaphobacter sp.]
MQIFLRRITPALIVFLYLFTPISLRAQVVGGSISGTVTDPSSAALSGATVVVHNDETGSERRLTTGDDGRFSAPSITIGTYTVSASHDGFTPQHRTGIGLTVGQSRQVDLQLTVNSVEQQVTVEDTPGVVNLSTQQTSGLIDERQIKQLPLNGRSYDQLVTLNPAVVNYTGQRSGSIGTSNSSVGNMYAISGRRPQDNIFLLNGIEYTGASLINLTPGGTSGQLLGVDAVREFNVVTDSYSASYGKRQGAQISIVTASGTNQVHGSVYEFLRNSKLDARNYFDQAKIPEFQRNNFGGSLGGPIRKDKLLLFANYEGYRQNLGLSNVTFVPDTQARQGYLPDPANPSGARKNYGIAPGVAPLLNLWPEQNGAYLLDANGKQTGIGLAYSNPMQRIREDFGTTRFDYNVTPKDLFFAVYTVDDSTADTPTQNPLASINEDLREQVTSLQEQHVFSPRLLNTARFGYSRASFFFLGSSSPLDGATVPGWVSGKPVGAIVIAGSTASNGSSQITGAGANVGSNNATTRNLFTFDDHIFWTFGRHQIEAGGWIQRMQSNDSLAQNQFGQASFASLTTFLQGTVKTFTVVPAPTKLGWRSWMGAAYIEDTMHLTPRLEIRAGLRMESTNGFNEVQGRAANYLFTNGVIDTNPTVGNSPLTNNRAKFLPAPRVGVAWDVFGDGKTSIRGGFGLHYSLLDNLNYRVDQAAPFNTTLSLSNVAVSSLNINSSTQPSAGTLISPSTVQTDIATPTVASWSLHIEQQIAPNTSLTLGYIGSHGYNQVLSADLNEPEATVVNGRIYYPTTTKANPAVANTTSWISKGMSNYNGLVVDVRHSLTRGLQVRGNYTFSKNLDNGSAWNTSVSANTPAFVSYPADPSIDYGRAATDIHHIVAINGSYDLPFGAGHLIGSNLSGIANRAVSGWTASTIVTLQSGFPFSPQLGYNPTGSGDTRNPVRPDINPNFHGNLYPRTVQQYFNPNAFLAPAYGTVGNLGRDTLTGPGLANVDISLLKATHITERVRAQFRAEFFNALNRANFATPNPVVFSSGPTQGTSSNQTAAIVASPTAGVVTATATTSRQIQFGLKLLF